MTKPSAFIGSSSEGLEFARACRALLADDAEITLWNEGFFGLGHTFIESLVNSLPRFDFAILILSSDDLVTSRDLETLGPRDNVIFEIGLFMGRLGRLRTFIVCHPAIKIPTDLSGVTTATYEWPREDRSHEGALGAACDKIRKVIREMGVSEAKTAKAIGNIESRQVEQEKHLAKHEAELRAIQIALQGIVKTALPELIEFSQRVFDLSRERMAADTGTLEAMIDAHRRLVKRKLDACLTPEERVAVWKDAAKTAQEIADDQASRFEAGTVPQVYTLAGSEYQKEVELELAKSKFEAQQ